jgi:competence protein ComEA
MKNNIPYKQSFILISFGVIIGLLMGGVIWIIASPPRGYPITLATRQSNQLISVYISGEVVKPGIYQIPLGSRVKDAIDIAGGFLSTADVELINQAALVMDSSQVNIPPLRVKENLLNTGININTASAYELETLPGIGPAFAKNIVDYRSENGPFTVIEEIQKVVGIGPVTFEKIRHLITIGE